MQFFFGQTVDECVKRRTIRFHLQLVPKAANVDIDGSSCNMPAPPNGFEEFCPRKHGPGVPHQELQKPELRRCQPHFFTQMNRRTGPDIQFETIDAQDLFIQAQFRLTWSES